VTFRFYGVGCLPRESYAANIRATLEQGFRPAERVPLHDRPLAVCGSGVSLRRHLDELKAWPGDVWGVNRTAAWLNFRNIKAAFYTCDPQPTPADMIGSAPCAVVATSADESVFHHMGERPVTVFHCDPFIEGAFSGGPTSASIVARVAPHLGYQRVEFFGCDGVVEGVSHVYAPDRDFPDAIMVEVDGRIFRTVPEFLLQTEYLAAVMRAFPEVYVNRSGDFIDAMIRADGRHEIVWMAPELAGKTGFVNKVAA